MTQARHSTFACKPFADSLTVVKPFPGAFRAGDYPATLEGAVPNGIQAAESCINYLNLPKRNYES